MTAKTRVALYISVAVIVVCTAVIVTVCLTALPGKNTGSVNHVVIETPSGQVLRGELEIGLTRERLESRTLNDRGFATDAFDDDPVDFTRSQANIFGIKPNTLVGPGCGFTAYMAVVNRKPYAFTYWLEIVPVGGESLLSEQLEFTVTVDGVEYVRRTLGAGLVTEPIETVERGETARFAAQLTYLDVSDNDKTKNATLSFDMVVHARLA